MPGWPPLLTDAIPATARPTADADAPEASERAARRTLRTQIARLERELSDTVLTGFEMRSEPLPGPRDPSPSTPRLLDLGELERVRDELAERLSRARGQLQALADEQVGKRTLLERMLLEPGSYRSTRISCRELGEPGCGVWEVRPRLGLIGMLMGWWQVTLSSGCPLDEAAVAPPRPRAGR